jgi:hypothetical protein
VLAEAAEPLHAAKVHLAVERELKKSVSRDSVNSCLSTGAANPDGQFKRLGRGVYQLR